MKKHLLKAAVTLAISFLAIFFLFVFPKRSAGVVSWNQIKVNEVAAGIRQFSTHYSYYPTNLGDLIANPDRVEFASEPFVDGHGNPFVYTLPTATERGFVGTYGKDRKPGGTGENQDILVQLGADPPVMGSGNPNPKP